MIEQDEWVIDHFNPLDADSLREPWPGCERFVSLANDGFGDSYVFDPKSANLAVRFQDHETGEFFDVTPTHEEFLKRVRESIEERGDEATVV